MKSKLPENNNENIKIKIKRGKHRLGSSLNSAGRWVTEHNLTMVTINFQSKPGQFVQALNMHTKVVWNK